MLRPTGRVPFSGFPAGSEPAFPHLPPAHGAPSSPRPRRVPAPASCTGNPGPAARPAPAGAAAPATSPRTPPSHAPWRAHPPRLPDSGAPPARTSASGRLRRRRGRPGTEAQQPGSGGRGRCPRPGRVENQPRGKVKAGGGGPARVVPVVRRCHLGSGRLSTPGRRLGGRDSAPAPAFSANWRQMAAPYRVLAKGQWREDRNVPQLRSLRFTVMQNRVDVGVQCLLHNKCGFGSEEVTPES